MHGLSQGLCVQVFVGETDSVGHTPRYLALIEYLRREGAAGATVVRGTAGFGANSVVKTASILSMSLDLPMVVTWVDAPARVERLLPGLIELAGSGVVTVHDVQVASYGGRSVEQFRFDLLVRDAMSSPVVSLPASATVGEALERLIGQPFRALPVVGEDGRLVGMLTNRDLVERGGLEARVELLSAMSSAAREGILGRLGAGRTVADVMTTDPVAIRATDTLARATHLMAQQRLKRLAVVDDDRVLVGMLSRMDVLRAAGDTFPREATAALDHAGARTIGEIMRGDPPTIPSGADLAAVIDALTSTRLNRAVVLDEERRPIAIISDADVVRAVNPAIDGGIIGGLMRTAGRSTRDRTTASDLGGRPPLTVTGDLPIAEAAKQLVTEAQKVLLVVDDDGRLLGIVDRADVLRAVGNALPGIAANRAEPEVDE
jgi:CBS domain-containing protein